MRLDNRTANAKPHSHAICFGCKGSLEDPAGTLSINSRSVILYRYDNIAPVIDSGPYLQQPCASYRHHRLNRVTDQV
jgi:hypothetical protein